YQDRVLDHQVGNIFPNHDAVVVKAMPFCCATASPAAHSSCARAFSYTFSRKFAPNVFSTREAQSMMRPDRSLSGLSFACSACTCGKIPFSSMRSAQQLGLGP